MKIVTTNQMKKVEDQTETLGISKKTLMANAGRKLADRIIAITSTKKNFDSEKINVVFMAGSGNNGGDCFVAANHLAYHGRCYNVTVINMVNPPSTNIAKEYFEILSKKIKIITGYYIKNISNENKSMSDVNSAIVSADILVDGVFGTNFYGELEQDIKIIFNINTSAYKIAVDIPSGGDGSTGKISSGCFKANETLCFGSMKFGMTQYPLKNFCGKINVVDIGIPTEAYDIIGDERGYHYIEQNDFADFFPIKREKDTHKGIYGTVLVISGSSSMRGAAVFSALGALKSGAGLVKVISVKKCINTVSILAPEATYIEIENDEDGYMIFNNNSRIKILNAIDKSNSIIIGPGIGVTNYSMEIVRFVLRNSRVPVVVDADAINCIAKDTEILIDHKSPIIITPHPGEMARLLNCETQYINDNRIMIAEKYAKMHNIVIVLKGASTLIVDSYNTSVNCTGNAGMSKGGSGDILSGIIGSALAQRYSPYYAACAGVYIHGLAGDTAADKYGLEAMLPRDIIKCISNAYSILKSKSPTIS